MLGVNYDDIVVGRNSRYIVVRVPGTFLAVVKDR